MKELMVSLAQELDDEAQRQSRAHNIEVSVALRYAARRIRSAVVLETVAYPESEADRLAAEARSTR